MTAPSVAAETLRLAAAATEGPWHHYEGDVMREPLEHGYGPMVASANFTEVRFGMPMQGFTTRTVNDAAFIAHARTAAPLLAQRVIELEKAVRAYLTALDAFRENKDRSDGILRDEDRLRALVNDSNATGCHRP